jgi:proteic killer suppression protein
MWSAILSVVERKLTMLDAAAVLMDLRKGQHSIRINAQWRICFVWGLNGPENVEIVDYH